MSQGNEAFGLVLELLISSDLNPYRWRINLHVHLVCDIEILLKNDRKAHVEQHLDDHGHVDEIPSNNQYHQLT